MIAVDLFSGVGGMALGFERAGFEVRAAFDSDHKHVTTYQRNFPHVAARQEDVRNVTAQLIADTIQLVEPIDVVFGGPPCQGFSVGGRRNVDDERNALLLEFGRVVSELRPRAFVAENVVGVLHPQYRDLVRQFYQQMAVAGYRMADEPLALNAEEFNVPQLRRRVFFIGVREDYPLPPAPVPVFADAPPELSKPDVAAALSDMPLLEEMIEFFKRDRYAGDLGEPTLYTSELRRPRVPNQTLDSIGGFLRTFHEDRVRVRFANTAPGAREPISRFHRLAWGGLAPTLRAGTTLANGKFMAPRPIHPDEHRVITVREAARLHSYPDWFEFHPTKWYGFMQVGNSVPPLLAEAVARSVVLALS